VNVAQGCQDVPTVVIGDGNGMVTTLPKVSVSIEQTIEAHRAVPVEPVHQSRHIVGLERLDEIVNVIAHDAQAVKSEAIPFPGSFDAEQQDLPVPAFVQQELAIVASHGHVIAESVPELAFGARHGSWLRPDCAERHLQNVVGHRHSSKLSVEQARFVGAFVGM
jgi:hypothetical protein